MKVSNAGAVGPGLRRVLERVALLPPADVENVKELVAVGELLVAYETLCTQIFEWGIMLSPSVAREIQDIGESLGAKPVYAAQLRDSAS